MNTIELTKDNVKYFHFTGTKFLEDIQKYGLIPRIGDNSIGAEDSAKVFFSKDLAGVAKCIDVWVRWRMVEFHKINTLQKFIDEEVNSYSSKCEVVEKVVDGKTIKEPTKQSKMALKARHKRAQDRFTEFIASGKADTPEARAYAYEDMFINWQNRSYLSLNLIEGEDKETAHFISSLVGEDKERQFNTGRIVDKKYLEYMYGSFEYETSQMDSWNMHTFPSIKDPKTGEIIYPGREVEADCIEGIISVDGKTDGLSVVKKIYELAPNKEDLPDFNKWLKYCKQREKENIQQQTIKKGKYEFSVYGTENDKKLVEAFFSKDINEIERLCKLGANINVPVMCKKYGKKFFHDTEESVIEQTTMPMLAHYVTKWKDVKNVQEEIDFINNCLLKGAQVSTIGNRYVMRQDYIDEIENQQIKEHILKINDSAQKTEHSLQPQDKKEKNKYILEDIENNVMLKQQTQALEYKPD